VTKTFWLSFVDPDGVPGQRHRGACVVDVSDEDVAALLAEKPLPKTAVPGAEWIAAAIRVAWFYECNPGGEVGVIEVDPDHAAPRNRLLVGDELAKWGERERTH